MCIDGGLDEGASMEELSEQILYYHHHDNSDITSTSATDAVQFAGLSSALQSLPNAVVGEESLGDETKFVHLDTSTLVFVPLEDALCEGIVAIAQVQRSSNPSDHGVTSPSPLAVEASVKRSHDLFCLLRGGIHHHLSSSSSSSLSGPLDETIHVAGEENKSSSTKNSVQSVIMNIFQSKGNDDDSSIVYPGMKELYRLRKQVRKQKRELARLTDASTTQQQEEELAASIAQLEERIQLFENALPITTLRKLLKTHYDEYIANAGAVAAATGILHSSLVDNVPAPIHVKPTEYSSLLPPSTVIDSLKMSVQSLLDKSMQECDANEPALVGISAFFHGEFVFARQATLDARMPLISAQTAYMLMEYMSSYRAKILLHAKQHSGQQQKSPPPRRIGSGLRRLISASLIDEDTIVTVDAQDTACIMDEVEFLSPPPLSMLNVSDQVLQVELPSHGKVWTPKIHLPCKKNDSMLAETLEANLVLLEVGEYSFLLYVRPGEGGLEKAAGPQSVSLEDESSTSSKQGTSMVSSAIITIPAYSRLLEMAAMELSRAVSDARDLEEGGSVDDHERENPLADCGEHVIFIDRSTQRVVLLSGESRDEKVGGSSKKSTCSELTTVDGEVSGIDSRHILASNLPPNVVMAFHDFMSEVHQRMESSNDDILQLCTYLPQGWVYAHAEGTKELYIFFKASKFVTVSDMSKEADRVRIQLYNDSIR